MALRASPATAGGCVGGLLALRPRVRGGGLAGGSEGNRLDGAVPSPPAPSAAGGGRRLPPAVRMALGCGGGLAVAVAALGCGGGLAVSPAALPGGGLAWASPATAAVGGAITFASAGGGLPRGTAARLTGGGQELMVAPPPPGGGGTGRAGGRGRGGPRGGPGPGGGRLEPRGGLCTLMVGGEGALRARGGSLPVGGGRRAGGVCTKITPAGGGRRAGGVCTRITPAGGGLRCASRGCGGRWTRTALPPGAGGEPAFAGGDGTTLTGEVNRALQLASTTLSSPSELTNAEYRTCGQQRAGSSAGA
jgi:hypothetical protein